MLHRLLAAPEPQLSRRISSGEESSIGHRLAGEGVVDPATTTLAGRRSIIASSRPFYTFDTCLHAA